MLLVENDICVLNTWQHRPAATCTPELHSFQVNSPASLQSGIAAHNSMIVGNRTVLGTLLWRRAFASAALRAVVGAAEPLVGLLEALFPPRSSKPDRSCNRKPVSATTCIVRDLMVTSPQQSCICWSKVTEEWMPEVTPLTTHDRHTVSHVYWDSTFVHQLDQQHTATLSRPSSTHISNLVPANMSARSTLNPWIHNDFSVSVHI